MVVSLGLAGSGYALRPLSPIEGEGGRRIALALRSAGLEEHFPAPVFIMDHPFHLETSQISYLNRYLGQLEILDQVLDDLLVRRVPVTGEIRVAFLGPSTGEEIARYWHALTSKLAQKGYTVSENPGPKNIRMRIIAMDKSPELMTEAMKRFQGESPFVYTLPAEEAETPLTGNEGHRPEIERLSKEIVQAVERDREIIEKSIQWVLDDFSSEEAIRRLTLEEVDVVVANTSIGYVEDRAASDRLWHGLMGLQAWLITTDGSIELYSGKNLRQVLRHQVAKRSFADVTLGNLSRHYVSPPPSAGLEDLEAKWRNYTRALLANLHIVPSVQRIRRMQTFEDDRVPATPDVGLARWEIVLALKAGGLGDKQAVFNEFMRRAQAEKLPVSDQERRWIWEAVEGAFQSAGLEAPSVAEIFKKRDVRIDLAVQGWAETRQGILLRVSKTELTGRLILQTGLKEPAGLPDDVSPVQADETTVGGMAAFLRGFQVNGADNLLFNAEIFTPEEALAATPAVHPLPAAVSLRPADLERLTAGDLAAILNLSRQTGSLYVLKVTKLDWEEETYLLIQA
ncbi:MAG: hypothetical protein NC819_02020 [Candidatus Omnitrophica bacterium]|nr:hypothetical protein [Candidatus Omnitrophota bacterium]